MWFENRVQTSFIASLFLWQQIFLFGMLGSAHAEEQFLPVDQAFKFESRSVNNTQAELSWQIAPEYYLYKYQFKVTIADQPVDFKLPQAKPKTDVYYGNTEVYEQFLAFKIDAKPTQSYQVEYQGCAEKGLCYPPVKKSFSTDENGLVILQDQDSSPSQNSVFATQNNSNSTFSNSINPTIDTETQTTQEAIQSQEKINEFATDQHWSDRLQQQSLGWSILVFLGLGCLLAFTPCSLPMLPILSSLLIRKHAGVRAIFISLVFVLCMASIYALLGVLAASAGSNLQRWLQQPFVLIGFSSIFIIFALNLFGVFELKLPQAWANRLDQLQAKQQGGTLIGAGVMGILSALLVGPCMTAPLAGTLLYISQTQNLMIGATLLFCLGLGMGIPLLLLTLIGQHAIPKPGIWMYYVRHIFAFLMIGLSLYFVRPLLSDTVLNIGFLAVVIALAVYLLWVIKREVGKVRAFAMILLISLLSVSIWQSVSYWHYQQNKDVQAWHVVTNQQQLDALLKVAKQNQQTAIIDLYADWCIACQPLEREVWSHPQVQIALDSSMKIKLDLSQYDASQQQILNELELLGPPTALFIDKLGNEQRHLRLTGTFTREKLTTQLKSVQGN